MKLLIGLIISLLISNCITIVNGILSPSGITYNSTSIVYEFPITSDYVSKWVLYNDINYPSDNPLLNMNVTFNCDVIVGSTRYCSYHSPDNFKKFSATPNSKYCVTSSAGEELPCCQGSYPCMNLIYDLSYTVFPLPFNVAISKPSTAGGISYVSGYLNRFLGFPHGIMSTHPYESIPSSGDLLPVFLTMNITDPLFDCNNFAVIMPPGTGKKHLYTVAWNENRPLSSRIGYPYQYASPIINSFNYDSVNSKLTLVGNNFGSDKSFVNVTINDVAIPQSNFNINVAHTSIELINYSRVIGFTNVKLLVDTIPMDINQYELGCNKPIITSTTSIFRVMGGVINLTGSFPSSSTSSLIQVGPDNCRILSYSQTSLGCELIGSTSDYINALPITFTITSGQNTCVNDVNVSFLYAPYIQSGTVVQNQRIITMTGNNFGSVSETVVNLIGNTITPMSINSDQNKLVFQLPINLCTLPNISVSVKRGLKTSNSIFFHPTC